jgi:hypothetical protein
MYRWHAERDLMLRRWRVELASHDRSYSHMALAPPGIACTVDCHCANGMGTMRKTKPFDCGKPRCHTCHWSKLTEPKRRASAQRDAIRFDLEAGSYFAESLRENHGANQAHAVEINSVNAPATSGGMVMV